MSDIDRFNYLRRYLAGQALATISGLTLNSQNYKEALDILIDRYGNPQVLISAHMETLVKINKVKNMENFEPLRKLYNDIENYIRNSKSLRIESSMYGYLLIPLLKEKIPDELNMIISRKFSGNVWTLELMLKYFNEELQAKETCLPFKSTSNEKDKVKDKNRAGYTTSCLHSESYESKSQNCVYCLENHSLSQCKRVTNRQSRIDILKKSYRCFLCLKSGHALKTCSAKYICRKFNGKHHFSICDKGENRNSHAPQNDGPNSIAAFVDQSKSILLQTARADVFNIETKSSVKNRILFDTGSQRC